MHVTRYSGLDVTKAIAILLVVFGHVWRGLQGAGLLENEALFRAVDDAIYLFHMPVFFFLSGLFIRPNLSAGAFFKSRLLLLIWPLLLWSWIECAALIASGQINASMLVFATYPFPPKSIYWFLWALFLIQVFVWLVSHLPVAVARALLAICAVYVCSGLPLVLGFDNLYPAAINFPYLVSGWFIANLGRRDTFLSLPSWFGGILFALGLTTVFMGWSSNGVPLFYIASLAATFGFILLCLALPAPGWLVALGQLTMPIYLSHILFTSGIRIALLKLGIANTPTHIILATMLGVLGPLILYVAARRLGLDRAAGFSR